LGLSKFVKYQIWAIILVFNNPEFVKEQIRYHCQYEKRTDRLNYLQKLSELG